MKNFEYIVGIDVAKDTLAISVLNNKKHHFSEIQYKKLKIKNDLIKPFQDKKDKVLFICENTGVYHQRLVTQLYTNGFSVSVINPFVIKKYSEMKMKRTKTDAVDARLIADYGLFETEIKLFKPKSKYTTAIDNLLKIIDDLKLQKTVSSNQLHAISYQENGFKDVIQSYTRHIHFMEKELNMLQTKLEQLLQENFKDDYELLKTIPGIGLISSGVIIGIYNSFESFENAKQACAFAGICPSPYESGTSVKGSGSISKKGNSFARKTLYMASLSAIQYNPCIKQQFERLVKNGKSKKQALIAAANKILRQAFGVLKHKKAFDANYVTFG